MKKILFLLVFGGVFIPLLAQKESLEIKMFFSDKISGEKAFFSGDFRYYYPNPDNLKAKPPKLAKGLPCSYLVLEEVRENKGKSPAWVLLPPGTPAEFNSSGIPIVDGRCWNKILEAYPVKEKYIPYSELSKLVGPAGRDGKDGINGKDGRNGTNGLDLRQTPPPPPSPKKFFLLSVLEFIWDYKWEILIGTGIYLGARELLKDNSSQEPKKGVGPGGYTGGPSFSIGISIGR